MLIPNKIISYKESIIFKMLKIVNYKMDKISIVDLYSSVNKYYDNVDEFIYSIEVLYLLSYIDVDFDKGEICYVNRSKK
nr:ABC-three component system middle component 7 [Clostridioides sp.]